MTESNSLPLGVTVKVDETIPPGEAHLRNATTGETLGVIREWPEIRRADRAAVFSHGRGKLFEVDQYCPRGGHMGRFFEPMPGPASVFYIDYSLEVVPSTPDTRRADLPGQASLPSEGDRVLALDPDGQWVLGEVVAIGHGITRPLVVRVDDIRRLCPEVFIPYEPTETPQRPDEDVAPATAEPWLETLRAQMDTELSRAYDTDDGHLTNISVTVATQRATAVAVQMIRPLRENLKALKTVLANRDERIAELERESPAPVVREVPASEAREGDTVTIVARLAPHFRIMDGLAEGHIYVEGLAVRDCATLAVESVRVSRPVSPLPDQPGTEEAARLRAALTALLDVVSEDTFCACEECQKEAAVRDQVIRDARALAAAGATEGRKA